MVDIAFPVSSRPGASAQEGAGRLINAYAEKLGDGGRAPVSIRRAPGLSAYAQTGLRNLRGARMSGGRLLATFSNRLIAVEAD